MNERGRDRTAAGLGTVGRRWAGEGVGGGVGLVSLLCSCLKREGGGGACLLALTRVSYVF